MSRIKQYKNKRRERWIDGEWGEKILIAMLIFAFPVGLYIMWREAWWNKYTKSAITAGWAVVLALFIYVILGTSIAYESGSVVAKEISANGKMLAPLPPEKIPAATHLLKSKYQASELISEPTPTPVPTYVYCNDNGVNYHLKGCRYVYSTTPRVTLNQALNAGKTACKICNPPKEETYNN